jgi:hypothetical protein
MPFVSMRVHVVVKIPSTTSCLPGVEGVGLNYTLYSHNTRPIAAANGTLLL